MPLARPAVIDAIPGTSRRRPKGDKRARTKAKLVQAAGELIRQKGFERTTLADVAQRVGMTSGAIYGNFRNRDDLFMAVAEVRGAPIIPDTRPGMTFAELMRAVADAVIAAIPQRRAAILGTLGFYSYALTHEEIRTRLVENTANIYGMTSAGTLALFAQSELPMPAERLVRALHAMTDGLLLHRFLTPELVPDEVIYAAFAAFVGKQ